MKRFQSRFERIRRVREQQERLARTETARTHALHQAASEALRMAEDELQTLQSQATDQISQLADGAMLNTLFTAGVQAEQTTQRGSEQVAHFHRQLQAALNHYRHTRSEVSVVEEIIGRERLEHRREQRRDEESQQQEQVAQTHFQRQQNNEGNES